MKIVLNKCYGGFGLSHEAKMKIFEKKGIEVFPYAGESDFEKNICKFKKLTDENLSSRISIFTLIFYFQIDPKADEFIEYFDVEQEQIDYKDDFDFCELDRTDKDLISTVEELGARANTRFSNLKVVEIPDGASYEISEYDGYETAHYGFQIGTA